MEVFGIAAEFEEISSGIAFAVLGAAGGAVERLVEVTDDVAGECDPECLHSGGGFFWILLVDEIDGFDGVKRCVVDVVAVGIGEERAVDVVPDFHANALVRLGVALVERVSPVIVIVDFPFVCGVFFAFNDIGKYGGLGEPEAGVVVVEREFGVAFFENFVEFGLLFGGELGVGDDADDAVSVGVPCECGEG